MLGGKGRLLWGVLAWKQVLFNVVQRPTGPCRLTTGYKLRHTSSFIQALQVEELNYRMSIRGPQEPL